ncbi:hypothetical protein EV361DRAFT_943842 [Lentinula raphanica]|uniref:Cytochrome c oxidase assembly protein n=1 Tax=Lentinula raphanica TaxID=153919 RepID=A0AA38UK87_9AGAR|nr:hypothetical protein C8R42DRAFT_721980 [Lentinula raphanica]KAJ3759792.1 hypothetical protein EV360DRAFT_81778 [Lentinula raphanica]KAJ3770044.1 hypothetical protein FB446DRAFT_780957 [Lentinula raphanica]KAJ3819857.1 hypothetical protein F5880DRAFT_1489013 [Lentinula raphanica]KAJ3844440.1 hypothetical protein F5878DRAFT_525814 [Lentinula raphanica]
MSSRAKITLAAATILSALTVWGVHVQQNQEREAMYRGVLKDDERRVAKMKQRQQEYDESQRRRELYERVQTVRDSSEDSGTS